MILVDSNVLVAAIAEEHQHNVASIRFLSSTDRLRLLIAAHSLSETYSTLTRNSGPFAFDPVLAQQAVADLHRHVRVVQFQTAGQTTDVIRRFAMLGGVGPRLYDYLIGATGEAFGADTIVTWNVRHFVPLFPHLRVATPAELVA